MKILNLFGKRMNAAAAMRLLAIIAALSGALLSASPCLAVNNALQFNGSDNYVITAAPVTAATNNVTIEAWVKWLGGTGNPQVLVYNGTPSANGYGILISPSLSNRIVILFGGITFVDTNVSFTTNTWQHIAVVRNAGTWQIYISGVLQGFSNTSEPIAPTGSTLIGGDTISEGFNGLIDEVRIWNVARTQSEIQASMNYQLAGSEFGLVAYYKFDEGSGTTLADSKSGYNGTLMNSPTWTTSAAPAPMTAPGNALSFNGSSQYVQANDANLSTSNFTFEGWIKPNTTGASCIYNNRTSESGSAGNWFTFYLDSANKLGIELSEGGLGASAYKGYVGSTALTPNVWYHIAVVKDASNLTFYVNGVQDSRYADTYARNLTGLGTATLGVKYGGTIYFNGQIDEFRIWNIARTQSEIQQNMYKTLSSGPVACYNFDQTGGTTLIDLAGGDNNGTLTNMSGTEWTAAAWNYGYPYVSTGAVSAITDTTASVAGTLVDAGIPAATDSGICYGTSANPTTQFNTNGFPASITGMTRATAYYARAYATNSAGTSYGSDVMFMTAPGNALSFNGSGTYVQASDPNLGTSNFTLETWIKPNSTTDTYLLHNRIEGDDNGNYFILAIAASKLNFLFAKCGVAPSFVMWSGNTVLSTGIWYHVAVVRSSQTVTMYLNGVQEGQFTDSYGPRNITTANLLRFGGFPEFNTQWFNGQIDEFRIWNTARSQADIQSNMNKTLVGNEGNLVAYYNFDQLSGTTLPDLAGGDNNGTLVGGPSWTPAAWNYGYPYVTTGAVSSITVTSASVAGSFVDTGIPAATVSGVCWNTSPNPTTANSKTTDGTSSGSYTSSLSGLSGGVTYYARAYATNSAGTGYGSDVTFTTLMEPPGYALQFNGSQYVNVPYNSALNSSTFTIEAWAKAEGGTGSLRTVIGNRLPSPLGGFFLRANDVNKWDVFIGDGSVWQAATGADVVLNEWTHLAAAYNGTDLKIYINGILSGTTSVSGFVVNSSQPFAIGNYNDGPSYYFNGKIDEVRLWNAARSGDQIRADMNKTVTPGSEPNLVAYYNFDRTSGTILPDLAGGDNDGTLNGPTWTDSAAFNVWTGSANTDWSNGSNWSDGVPTAASNVYIPSVTNQPSVSGAVSCNHIVIVGGSLTLTSGTLDVKGNIFNSGTITGAGTVVCSGGSAQTLKIGSLSNLTVSNAAGIILDSNLTVNGTLTMTSGSITPGAYTIAYGAGGTLVYNASVTSTDIEFPAASGPANLTINNNVTLHASRTLSGTLTLASSCDLSIGANNTLTLNGGISGSGTLTGGDASDLIIGGTGNVTLPANALTLNNLTLNRPGAVVILGNHLTVKGTLTLTAGILKVPSYNLILGEAAQIAGTASASAMIVADIIGEVRKTIADGAAVPLSFTFPVGSDSGTPEYSPVTLNFTAGIFASAYVAVRLKDLQYPVNDSPTDYLQRYWTLTQSGITAFSCDATFSYVPGDIQGTETKIYGKRDADSVWTNLNQAGSNQFTGTVTAFGSFTGADHSPKVAAPLADVTVYEDAAPTSISLSSVFSDFDDDNLSVVKTVASNTNPGLVSAVISGETLTLGYAADGNGSATIVIRGTANEKYAEDTFAVTVIPVDDAPVVSQKIADVTVSEDAPPTVIALSGVFADIDSASIVKSVLSNSGPGLLGAAVEGDTLTLTYLKDQSSTADIVIRGTADGQYADTAFKVTVTPVDDMPVWVTEIEDVKVTDGDPDTVIALAGRVTDIDNEQSRIVFSAKSANTSLVSSFVAGTSLTLRYSKDRAGETTVTVTALSGGKTVSDTFSVILGTLKYAVSGKAIYFSNLLPIPNMKIMLTGKDFYTGNAVSADTLTDSSGNYLFSDIVRGDYTVTPFKNDPPDPKKLTAADADIIADVALGLKTLTPAQYKAADVTLNGRVSGLDASRTGRFKAGLITEMSSSGAPTPGWVSDPESLSFFLNSDTEGRDFTMYLTGDVSGSYTPGASDTSAREPGRTAEIMAEQGSVLSVAIVVGEETEFHGIDLDIEYNEIVLSAREATLDGGILNDRDYETAVNLTEPGRIRMAIFGYSGNHITGSGTVVILHFDVVGPLYGSSLLSFTRFDCNELPVSAGNKEEREDVITGGFYADGTLSDSLRIIVTPDPNYDPMDYDMNGDGKIDMKDTLRALQDGRLESAIRALQILTWR